MKKYTDNKGRFKDYLKGIISLVGGVLLIILGVVWLDILPLAIVLFVIGVPAVFTGLGLIIHNKKNNTHYSGSSSSSSSSSGSASTSGDWENKFKEKIENYPYGAYKTASVYASLYEGKIEVNVKVDYFGSSDEEIIAKSINEMISDVKSAYKSVAKKCPYPSELKIETK